MRQVEIKTSTFGDEKEHPVLIPLVEILKESEYKHFTRCAYMIQSYRTILNEYNGMDKEIRLYTYRLIKEDYLKSLECSYLDGYLPKKVYTHIRNLIVAIYRNKCNLINGTKR